MLYSILTLKAEKRWYYFVPGKVGVIVVGSSMLATMIAMASRIASYEPNGFREITEFGTTMVTVTWIGQKLYLMSTI
jgi:hypothetical protein